MPTADLDALARRMATDRILPRLGYHFLAHGRPGLGLGDEREYLAAFHRHIVRDDLLRLSFLRERDGARMWYLVAPETGATAQYNETRGAWWSFFLPADIGSFLDVGVNW